MLPQHAEADLHVEREAVEAGVAEARAQLLAVLRDAAERDQGTPPRLIGREALLAHEALLDALADPPSVRGVKGQRLEDEEVEGAAECVGLLAHASKS